MKNLKQQLLQGKTIEFINHNEDLILVWFQPKTNNFCLELNCKVVKATRTFKPIQEKLESLQVM